MADLKSREKARKLAEDRNLTGLANDTKWTEFFGEVARLKIPLQLKLLDADDVTPSTRVWLPAKNYLDSQFGPNLFVFIEWVRSSAVEEIKKVAETTGLESTVKNDEITVYGYR
jgi:hypothetical protein